MVIVVKFTDGYTTLFWQYLVEGLFGKHKSRWEDNIKICLEGIL
jgi:hypothetical protein